MVLAAVAAALACAAAAAPGPRAAQADPPDVVLVTGDCDSGSLVCGPFVRAAKRTGAQARIVSPTPARTSSAPCHSSRARDTTWS